MADGVPVPSAGTCDIDHKDPFDRLPIAQALIEGVPVVSDDTVFERIW